MKSAITHKLLTVDISTLHFDETNPNHLTDQQMTALRKSMEKYGYLAPVIIDQDNNIADGEHRVLVYKQLGRTQIPVYRLNLTNDTDRRILRQVMNKLHGEHELTKDTQEIIKIIEGGQLAVLSELLKQQEKSFQYMVDQFNESQDKVLEALSDEGIETNHKCPKCGYEW